jgi:hypothetical protein
MRKVQLFAVIFTLALAIPFTALALIGVAYFTDHVAEITSTVTAMANWRGVALEGSARWPELAGMIVGQLLILSILLIARRNGRADESTSA